MPGDTKTIQEQSMEHGDSRNDKNRPKPSCDNERKKRRDEKQEPTLIKIFQDEPTLLKANPRS